MRVCYAELGMTLLLQLQSIFIDEIRVLRIAVADAKDPVTQKRAQSIIDKMTQMMKAILGFDQKGLAFMGNWLSVVVDTVPISK